MDQIVRAKRPERLPVVLTRAEVRLLLEQVDGMMALIVRLLYGSGLRLFEALELRVKDLDLEKREIHVRDGKGRKDRRTMLLGAVIEPLRLPSESASSTIVTSPAVPVSSPCPTRSGSSTRPAPAIGPGSGRSLPPATTRTR
jgi:Phage integrase family